MTYLLRMCTGNERMSYQNGYEPERQLQFVTDAVMAFAYAFKSMHQDQCQGRRGICSNMTPYDGTELLGYLRQTRFIGKPNN